MLDFSLWCSSSLRDRNKGIDDEYFAFKRLLCLRPTLRVVEWVTLLRFLFGMHPY